MSKHAFDKIAEGINEALAIARGEVKARLYVPAKVKVRQSAPKPAREERKTKSKHVSK